MFKRSTFCFLCLLLSLCLLVGCGSTSKQIYNGDTDKIESATLYRMSSSGCEKKEVSDKEVAVQIASDLQSLTYEEKDSDETVYMGAWAFAIQLHYEDGSYDWFSFIVIGQGDVMYIPIEGERYHFTWPEADTLFHDLDYPTRSFETYQWLGPR